MTDAPLPPRQLRWSLWLPLVLFIGFVALVMLGLLRPASHDIRSQMVGKPLPQFTLRAAVPNRPGLAATDFASGKPRLLNIFASWCIPCAIEAPQLAVIAEAGVEVDGIAINDKAPDLVAFLARKGNPFTRLGADDVRMVQLAMGSSGVPESFIIDGKGVIRYQHIGDIRQEDIPMILAKLREAGQ